MKKSIRKIVSICISAVIAFSIAVVPVSADNLYTVEESKKAEIMREMEAAGFREMTDEEVAEMFSKSGGVARSGYSLPYSGSIYYTGTADAAYSPIIDLSSSETSGIQMTWKSKDGIHKLRTELQVYVEVLDKWYDETAKNINISYAILGYPTTVSPYVSKFAVKFERYQRNADNEITDECSTNFDYKLSSL